MFVDAQEVGLGEVLLLLLYGALVLVDGDFVQLDPAGFPDFCGVDE